MDDLCPAHAELLLVHLVCGDPLDAHGVLAGPCAEVVVGGEGRGAEEEDGGSIWCGLVTEFLVNL